MTYLLDTNIVSLALRNDLRTKNKLEELTSQKVLLSISCITYSIFRLNEIQPLTPLPPSSQRERGKRVLINLASAIF